MAVYPRTFRNEREIVDLEKLEEIMHNLDKKSNTMIEKSDYEYDNADRKKGNFYAGAAGAYLHAAVMVSNLLDELKNDVVLLTTVDTDDA